MLSIDRLFSDHMVLQREKEIRLWGRCTSEDPVYIQLSKKEADEAEKAVLKSGRENEWILAEKNGEIWSAVLPPRDAGHGFILTAECGTEKVQVKDICIGEVWVAAGQSNMEFWMRYDSDFEKEKEECAGLDIRFFDVPEVCYPGQEEEHDYSRMGFWRKSTPEDLEYFSAAAYYFAKKISMDKKVPVGIIGCNRGGSVAAAWMSREVLKDHGKAWLEEFKEVADTGDSLEKFRHSPEADTGNPFADVISEELLFGMSREKQLEIMAQMPPEMQVPQPGFNNRPGCLYENMLRQIIPCSVRGVLWYQGESDAPHAEAYKEIFRDLIRFWRKLWMEDLPFCCVQLAPFEAWMACDGENFPIIRQAQREIAEEEKGVYLVSTSDVGMRYDIHPKKKRPVGERLALCAEKHVYGMKADADAPIGKRAYRKGEELIIEFGGDGNALELRGGKVDTLKIEECVQGVWKEIPYDGEKARMEGKKLMVPLKFIEGEKERTGCGLYVRFAQTGYYEVDLYSDVGLPAMPFRCRVEEE